MRNHVLPSLLYNQAASGKPNLAGASDSIFAIQALEGLARAMYLIDGLDPTVIKDMLATLESGAISKYNQFGPAENEVLDAYAGYLRKCLA